MSQNSKTEEQKDNDNYAKNFTRVPNILFESYKYLTKEEVLLYIRLRYIYWDTKPRYLSLRELADITGYSTGALSKMLPRLTIVGLIHTEIRRKKGKDGKEKGNPIYHITINDIWEENRKFFTEGHFDPSEALLVHEMNETSSPNEQDIPKPVHQMNRLVHKMNDPVHETRQDSSPNEQDQAQNNPHKTNSKTIDNTSTQEESVTPPVADTPTFGASAPAPSALPLQEKTSRSEKGLTDGSYSSSTGNNHPSVGSDCLSSEQATPVEQTPKQTAPEMSFVEARDYLRSVGYFLEPTPLMNGNWEIGEPDAQESSVIKDVQVILIAEYQHRQRTAQPIEVPQQQALMAPTEPKQSAKRGSRKPPKPKVDAEQQARIDKVYSAFDKLMQEVTNNPEAKYARTQAATEAITELLSCNPTEEKLHQLYLEKWKEPRYKNGFKWSEHMTIPAICNQYGSNPQVFALVEKPNNVSRFPGYTDYTPSSAEAVSFKPLSRRK